MLRDLQIQPWGSMACKWHLKWVVCSRKKNTEREESSGQDLRGHQNQRGAQCETWHRGLRTHKVARIERGDNRERGELSRRDTHGCRQNRKGLSDKEREWRRGVGRGPWAERASCAETGKGPPPPLRQVEKG